MKWGSVSKGGVYGVMSDECMEWGVYGVRSV